ncbi:MAG TPA: peptidylprolyl isomerase [Armatimonadota bacterium]
MTQNTPRLSPPTPEEIDAAKAQGRYLVTITMDKGGIIEVVLEGAEMPLTTANLVKLIQTGYYNGLTFHRVVPDFVIQGGDPSGNGTGGPGYAIKLEISPKLKHKKGAISMARSQSPDSAGSQFFLCLADTPHLDSGYAVFGWTKSGQEVIDNVKVGDRMKTVTVEPYSGTEADPLVG